MIGIVLDYIKSSDMSDFQKKRKTLLFGFNHFRNSNRHIRQDAPPDFAVRQMKGDVCRVHTGYPCEQS